MTHKKILTEFSKFKTGCGCGKVFCTTCGGLAGDAHHNMTAETRNKIKELLSDITLSDFASLGEWREFISRTYPNEVQSILNRESQKIDTSDIDQLDQYLLLGRKLTRRSPAYIELLSYGANIALEGSNESLIETVILALGEEILNHKNLFELALEKSKTNKNIHRALYNNLRETVPDVRGYTGNPDSSL